MICEDCNKIVNSLTETPFGLKCFNCVVSKGLDFYDYHLDKEGVPRVRYLVKNPKWINEDGTKFEI